MRKLLLLLIMMLVVTFGFSQVTTSKIQGHVTDDTNLGLFGANIVAKHVPTGTVSGTMSLESGKFTLPNLRVGGPYTITISYLGFKTVEYTDVYLDLGKVFNVTIKMIGDSEQLTEIVISGGKNTTFSNDRTGAQTSVGRKELTTLPTISRSASDFTRLDPTASGGSFGGKNDQFNNFSLDGAIFTNPFGLDAATPGGQTDSQPISLDAIAQIQVSTAPYDVSQSGFTGASINAVTKSGSNEVKGTVYGFFRNQDLTGSKVKGEDIFVPELEQKQYGFSIGGPIIKDKLFVFANFEKDERTDAGSSWIANTGSGAINESRVLASDLMDVSSALSSLGYETGPYQGYTHESASTKGIIKLDWNINDKHRFALIYNFLDASKERSAHPTALGFRGPDASVLQFKNTGYEINNKIQSFQLELNSNFTDKLTNKIQAGYTHFDDFRNPLSTAAPTITILDGAGTNYIIAGHEPFSIHNKLDQKVFQISDKLNYFTDNHTVTLGFSFEKFMFDNSFNIGAYGGRGVFFPSYGSVAELVADSAPGGGLETMLNEATAANNALHAAGEGVTGGWALAETNVGQVAAYLQDEMSVNDNFTLTYGVRIDKPLFFNSDKKAQEVIDRACCHVPSITYYNPQKGEDVLVKNTTMPTDKILFSPRIGFNWDVKGDDSFQLRGGTGLFTGRLPFVWIGNQIANPEVFFYNAVDPDFQFPQVVRSSFGADIKLKNGLTITSDLVVTKDINGVHVQNWGLRTPSGNLVGVDNRAIYLDSDKGNSGYVFTNSRQGETFNFSTKLQKTFNNGLYTSLAYSFLESKDVNSIEAEITSDAFAANPAIGNVNNDVLSHSKYGDKHRVIGVISKQITYGSNDQWKTTFSTFFEYAQGGRFSYTYGGDINNDGSGLNDLLFIPTVDQLATMNFSGTGDAVAFESFIQQDDYLSSHRGEYFKRYGALAPWRGKWDVKFMQELKLKNEHTIQFSIDVLNFGNMINSDWGVVQLPSSVQPVSVSVDAVTKEPTYSFNSELQKTYVYNADLISRWQMQFGLRYTF